MLQDPALKSLHLKLWRSITSGFLWSYATKFTGQGMEFADMRQYAHGDDIKHIDWRTSAKKWELYTKKFVEERQLRVWFVVPQVFFSSNDTSPQPSPPERGSALGIKMRELMYAIGYAALKNGDRVGAIRVSGEGKVRVEKMSGKWESLYRMLQSPGRSGQEVSWAQKMRQMMRYVLIGTAHQAHQESDISINDQLQLLLRLRTKGTLIVIPAMSTQVDISLIKKLWIHNEILYIQCASRAQLYLESSRSSDSMSMSMKSMTEYDIYQWVQIWAGGQYIRTPTSERGRAYISAVRAYCDEMKRVVQSVWGRYMVIDETSDVVRSLMQVMQVT